MMFFLKNRRVWLLAAAVGAIIALRWTGVADYLSLDTLRANRQDLVFFVQDNFFTAVIAYLVIYVVTTTFALPGAVLLTLAGGFLFGPRTGTILTVIGATSGATIIFLYAKAMLGEHGLECFGPKGARLAEIIKCNAWSYMLVLRITPLFPFFLVNLISPLAGVDLRTYVITTFLGIIPGAAVFSSYGAGLGTVLDEGGTFSIKSILTPEIFAASIGLAVLVLLAIPVHHRFFCSVHPTRSPKDDELKMGKPFQADR